MCSSSSRQQVRAAGVQLTSLHCRRQRAESGAVGGIAPYHACHGALCAAGSWQVQIKRVAVVCVTGRVAVVCWCRLTCCWLGPSVLRERTKRLTGDQQPKGATNDDPANKPRRVETAIQCTSNNTPTVLSQTLYRKLTIKKMGRAMGC